MPGYFKEVPFRQRTSIPISSNICIQFQPEKNSIRHKIGQIFQEKTRIENKQKALSFNNQQLVQTIIEIVAKMLEKNMNQSDDSLSTKKKCLSKLNSLLQNFLIEMQDPYLYMIVSVIYLDKIHKLNENFHLTEGNMVSFMAAALLASVKFFSDNASWNHRLAKVFNIQCFILNQLQRKILNLLNFELYVKDSTYGLYRKKLEQFAKRKRNQCALIKKN